MEDKALWEQAQKQGDFLFNRPCSFLLGVVKLDDLPPGDMPEIAFAGRSNVGKSSLLNALTNQRQLARASSTPGRTQELNFFDLGHVLYIADLPGYGFAKATKKEVQVWNNLVFKYLKGRPALRRVFLLVDSRHGLKDSDIDVMKMLDKAAVSYQLVLTKTDKIKVAELEKMVDQTSQKMKTFTACHPQLLATSSEKKEGLDDLKANIWALLNNVF